MKIVAKLGTLTFIKLILLVTRELCKIYQTVYIFPVSGKKIIIVMGCLLFPTQA